MISRLHLLSGKNELIQYEAIFFFTNQNVLIDRLAEICQNNCQKIDGKLEQKMKIGLPEIQIEVK